MTVEVNVVRVGPHFIKFSKIVSYEVNLAAQSSHLEVLLLSKVWPKMWDFNSCGQWFSRVLPLMLWWWLAWFPYFFSDCPWPYCALSEALILAATNPKYFKRLFIELRVQYMKITSTEHVV